MYRILFPLDINDENEYTTYDISIVSEGLGIVNSNYWHFPLQSQYLEEGLKLAKRVLATFVKDKKCPCKGERCRLISLVKYPVGIAQISIKKGK